MNTSIQHYAHYNQWANLRLIGDLSQLSPELLHRQLVSSFPSIPDTVQHIWGAEASWLFLLKNGSWSSDDVWTYKGDFAALIEDWKATSAAWVTFATTVDSEASITFSSRGKEFTMASSQVAHHVFNHSTYHRGQIVTMLRQLGIDDISKTDYIEWLRVEYDSQV